MAWYYLAQTYGIGYKQPANAASAFRRAVTLRPQWPEAWHALAYTLGQTKQYQPAIVAARQSVTQAPDRLNYWNELVALYSFIPDPGHALETLRAEQQHMSRATNLDWYNLGNGYSDMGSYKEAIVAYAHSLRMKADYGNAWNNLGVAEESLGQNATALADYQRAANLGNRLANGNYARLKQLSTRQQAPNRGGGPTFFCMTTGTTLHAGQICPTASAARTLGTLNPLYRDP
jgi:tetratricopeptide (TPR) repeat protein